MAEDAPAQDCPTWIRVGTVADLTAAGRLVRTIAGVELLILRYAGGVVAIRNACTHLGQPLAQGRVMAGQIHCPFHGACFDLETGEALSGPAVAPLQRFETRIIGAEIHVATANLPADTGATSINIL
jgi:nitrite reductase/ring-hydroxylating ferredoxin subunit